MEDDGMLMNFASAPASTSSGNKRGQSSTNSTAVKSQRWTDKLKASRSNKKRTPAIKPDATTARPESQISNKASAADTSSTISHSQPAAKPKNYISSLFTSNPKIARPIASTSTQISAPSNAPSDGSFASLQLNPLLTAHLTTKMHIDRPTAIQRAALAALLPPSGSVQAPDALIQAQTGSGKTLAFLLPIIQDLLPLSSLSHIDRSAGTLAIILAPTRELARQISDVLEAVLKLSLNPPTSEEKDESDQQRLTRWIVSGLLTGGSTRQHEKAKLRKGVPIIVATPGRLLDHLQNTVAFDFGKCRWLVLDEADRLLELGFEPTIIAIQAALDGRRRQAIGLPSGRIPGAAEEWSNQRRRNILCSATINDDVKKLAGNALMSPLVITGTDADLERSASKVEEHKQEKFTPPSQLEQKYVVTPYKLRLVALTSLLRLLSAPVSPSASALASGTVTFTQGNRIIVFLSCTDSVDWHWNLLGGVSMGQARAATPDEADESSDAESFDGEAEVKKRKRTSDHSNKTKKTEKLASHCPLIPNTNIYRLHGSLSLSTRISSLQAFSAPSQESAVLLCTSVASRGLDLPLVRAVVQYDLPTEGGPNEYVHRVGRTARAGKGGEAWSFVAPSETKWVPWLENQISDTGSTSLREIRVEEVLKKGFGGKGNEYEARATDAQLAFERWVLNDDANSEGARSAFLSSIRAYATHPVEEKQFFHVKNIHLGHFAKAFALREAPSTVGTKKPTKPTAYEKKQPGGHKNRNDAKDEDTSIGHKMYESVRQQGRAVKSGAGEFQVGGTYDLENLVRESSRR